MPFPQRFAVLVGMALPLTLSSVWGDEANALQALIAKVRPSIATIRVQGRDGNQLGIGTGFVIDPAGLIVTNFHVINEGREFTIELSSGEKLEPLAIEASDRTGDLAIIRVAVRDGKKLPALPIAGSAADQGTQVMAFGNPLGLENSVVDGIVSAIRQVQEREMIQLAMPIEPGNSGGPVVDRQGRVVGVINMKSAIDDNLGFAIPISQLKPLQDKPNPVSMDRWVRLGTIDAKRWQPLSNAIWQERGGVITASGMGKGFGGRSLCLTKLSTPNLPYEVAVMVKLDDESGAAGLAFHSDAKDRHYGFYPSNGRLRLTCFKGATVYSWEVLEEIETDFYLPGQWNRLRLRITKDEVQCYVNGHRVITTTDQQLKGGRVGLCKFRNTNPEFKRFRIGDDLQPAALSNQAARWFEMLEQGAKSPERISAKEINELGKSSDAAARELQGRASALERQAAVLEDDARIARRLAADVQRVPTLNALRRLFATTETTTDRLLTATLLVAKLDNPEIEIEYYRGQVAAMATEIRGRIPEDADPVARRMALDEYLFKENGFHGGRSEYHHPANSHLNRVIDDREGLPITLSILYMDLGRRLNLRIDGVGLPGRFIVNHIVSADQNQYVDVFDSGKALSDEDVVELVRDFARRRVQDEDLRPQTDLEICRRVLNNLMNSAAGNEDVEAMMRYSEAGVAIEPESVESRIVRAQIRVMTGRKTLAIDDIDWLINNDPPGVDQDRLQRMRLSLEE